MSTNDTGYAAPPPDYSPPPPGASAPPRPPLRRTTGEHRVVAGVSAGVARSLGIDPILVRVAFVILTLFGGSGILLYLAGWLFIPEDGQTDSTGERFFRNSNALVIAGAVVVGLIVVGPMLAWGRWHGGFGFGGVLLLLLVIAGAVALSRRDSAPTGGMGTAASVTTTELPPAAGGAQPPTPPAPYVPAVEPGPPAPPPPPKERSVLGRLTLGVALLVSGGLVALDLAGAISVSAVTVLAAALAVVALGLLVGTFVGRSRGLIVLGVLLSLVLVPLSAVPDGLRWNAGDGVGDRVYRVASVDDLRPEYSLGAGTLTVDLSNVQPDVATHVDASVGAGEVVVLLPPGVPTTVTSDVGIGSIDMPTEPERGGINVHQTWERPVATPAAQSTGSFDLDLSAAMGTVTVVGAGPTGVGSR